MVRRLGVVLATLVCACATPPMPAQQPTLANVQLLRAAEMPSMGLGEFTLAPGLPARMDRSVSVRAGTLSAPDGSFARYLRQTLEAELRAAGKLDVGAPVQIAGQITRSEVSTPLPNSRGVLGARFVVTRGGETVFDRELVVEQEWPSNFIGAIAIPQAMDRYTALYPSLVSLLLNDDDFRAAVRAP